MGGNAIQGSDTDGSERSRASDACPLSTFLSATLHIVASVRVPCLTCSRPPCLVRMLYEPITHRGPPRVNLTRRNLQIEKNAISGGQAGVLRPLTNATATTPGVDATDSAPFDLPPYDCATGGNVTRGPTSLLARKTAPVQGSPLPHSSRCCWAPRWCRTTRSVPPPSTRPSQPRRTTRCEASWTT